MISYLQVFNNNFKDIITVFLQYIYNITIIHIQSKYYT
jgi:hypothetical protein